MHTMMESVRMNRAQLKYKPIFRKGDAPFERAPLDGRLAGALDCSPAPKAVLRSIRHKMQRQRLRQRWLMAGAILFFAALTVALVILELSIHV